MSAEQLETAAAVLGPVLNDVVFVGGASIHVWITEPAAPPMRVTMDVDVICAVASRPAYHRIEDRLRERGMTQDAEDSVICRWRHRRDGLVLDVMPTDQAILGFSNPWYEIAVSNARPIELESGNTIKIAGPVELLATKLAAWRGRGSGDILASLDLHDVLSLFNGRPELVDEVLEAALEVRSFIINELAEVQSHHYFNYAVESVLNGYGPATTERAKVLLSRIDQLVSNAAE